MSKKRKSNFRNKTVGDAKQQSQKASSYGYLNLPKGVKAFTMKEKTRSMDMDIIPYEITVENHPDRYDPEERAMPGTLWYKRPFKVHKNVGADNQTVICRGTIKKKCPICEYVTEKLKTGADWNEMKEVGAKDRNLYAIIPLDSDEHDEEIHIWDMSQYLFQNELNDQLEEDEDNGIFPDLEEGKTLEVKFKWKTFGKFSYPETRDISFNDRDEVYKESILDEVPDLDSLLDVKSYQELHDLFFEVEDDDPDDDSPIDDPDEEEKKPPRRKKKVEEEEESEDEPKEEKEEKPTRRRRQPEKEEEKEPENKKPTRRGHPKKDDDNKCPHGHTFGKDCEEYDECDECNEWDDCIEEKDKLTK